MIVETHCHTSEHSPCSHVAAVDLVRRVCEAGVQTIVLTDHHYQWSEEELADLRRRAGLPEICQILAGQEVETYDFGHVLIYGARATIPALRISLLQIRAQYPDAAIDFDSSYQLPRAFDVGTFLAQYISMFFREPDVQRHAPAYIFPRTYLDRVDGLEEDFTAHVDLFKARTCLSILYYLAKVQMGDTEEFWRILVEAERSLAAVAAGQGVTADNHARRR